MRCQQFFSNSHLMIHWFQFLRIVIPTSQKIIIPLYLPSSIDGSFQRLELKIYDLNKSVDSKLAVLNKKMDTFSEYFNKLVNSSLPSHQGKSLEENISLLRKILCTKDEIIKKLLETHNTVLNTISAKSNNQHSNTLNQSSSFSWSNNLNNPSQESQDPPIARPCFLQLQQISHPSQTHHQRPEQNIAMENIYVGNLSEDIIKQDICELFVLNSTSYLRDTCNVDFPLNKKTGNLKALLSWGL